MMWLWVWAEQLILFLGHMKKEKEEKWRGNGNPGQSPKNATIPLLLLLLGSDSSPPPPTTPLQKKKRAPHPATNHCWREKWTFPILTPPGRGREGGEFPFFGKWESDVSGLNITLPYLPSCLSLFSIFSHNMDLLPFPPFSNRHGGGGQTEETR